MNGFTGIAIYMTIWWTVLFAVLPIGNITHAEAGIDKGDGGDPGAPVNPDLKRKFILTSLISAFLFLILWLVMHFNLIPIGAFPGHKD